MGWEQSEETIGEETFNLGLGGNLNGEAGSRGQLYHTSNQQKETLAAIQIAPATCLGQTI